MESVLILSSGCMSQVVKFDCNCLKKVVEFKFQDRQSLTEDIFGLGLPNLNTDCQMSAAVLDWLSYLVKCSLFLILKTNLKLKAI